MDKLNDYINGELTRAFFGGGVCTLFPEMHFEWNQGKERWESRLKIDGTPYGDKGDKTIITKRYPKNLFQTNGGFSLEFVKLLEERGNYRNTFEAVKEIAKDMGIDFPFKDNISSEHYEKRRNKQEQLQELCRKMEAGLWEKDEAKAVREYLENVRGYEEEFIRECRFGYCDKALFLELCTILEEDPKKQHPGIGTVNVLSFPYVNRGEIVGFIFRIPRKEMKDGETKYIDMFLSEEETKKYHLFGLQAIPYKSSEEILAVEGEIDALRGQFFGLPVVAVSGGIVKAEALEEAKRQGVKEITLLFDKDSDIPVYDKKGNLKPTTKYDDTLVKTEKAVKELYRAGITPRVSFFGGFEEQEESKEKKIDLDSYLLEGIPGIVNEDLKNKDFKTKGRALIEELYMCEGFSLPGADFLVRQICTRLSDSGKYYINVPETRRSTLIRRVTELIRELDSYHIPAVEREIIYQAAEKYGDISKEALREDNEEYLQEYRKQQQEERLKKLCRETLESISKGDDVEITLNTLKGKIDKEKDLEDSENYSDVMAVANLEDIKEELQATPAGIKTSYYFEGSNKRENEYLTLKDGGLTFICGRTSHGKTAFMYNLALQAATQGDESTVLFYFYESTRRDRLTRLFNTYANLYLSDKENNDSTLKEYWRGNKALLKEGIEEALLQEEETFENYVLKTGRLRLKGLEGKPGDLKDNTLEGLITSIRQVSKRTKIKAVFIDYIQLIRVPSLKGAKEELSRICPELMKLAAEINVPFIIGSQLNREVKSPLDMGLETISDASNIEHSANTVVLLYNSAFPHLKDNLYDRTPERKAALLKKGYEEGKPGKIYAIMAKNRDGAPNIWTVLDYNANTGKIANPGEIYKVNGQDYEIPEEEDIKKPDMIEKDIPFEDNFYKKGYKKDSRNYDEEN